MKVQLQQALNQNELKKTGEKRDSMRLSAEEKRGQFN